VLGVEAVLVDGSVASRLGGILADNTGYDLAQLMVGSEGSQANGDYARLETCNAENKGEQWADYGASPFGGTIYNLWNGNNLGTADNSAANGTPVGTYIGGPQLSLSRRPL
jgi:hypothetical protein